MALSSSSPRKPYLAVHLNRFVPGPHAVDKLLVGRVLGVELLEVVTLPVRSDFESLESVLPSNDKGPLDHRVVCNSIDGTASHNVLPAALKTSEEAAWTLLVLAR